jgi:hypothetical protein
MKKYRIIDKILLSFIIDDEQHDILLSPESNGHLEATEKTVWFVDDKGGRFESITTANIIDVAIARNALELL